MPTPEVLPRRRSCTIMIETPVEALRPIKGHSSLGSKESGTPKHAKYGLYCYDAKVYQQSLFQTIEVDTG